MLEKLFEFLFSRIYLILMEQLNLQFYICIYTGWGHKLKRLSLFIIYIKQKSNKLLTNTFKLDIERFIISKSWEFDVDKHFLYVERIKWLKLRLEFKKKKKIKTNPLAIKSQIILNYINLKFRMRYFFCAKILTGHTDFACQIYFIFCVFSCQKWFLLVSHPKFI